jgi:hypothetical protein
MTYDLAPEHPIDPAAEPIPASLPKPAPAGPADGVDAQAKAQARLFRRALAAGQLHPLQDLLRRYRAGERA